MVRPLLGDLAPNFEQQSSVGLICFHEYLGNDWGVLFSHPADFTPVCTTELACLARFSNAFSSRRVKILAISVDTVQSHVKWIKDINSIAQEALVNYPIIADVDKKVCKLYGMIHPNSDSNLSVRSVFVIDPKKKIRLIIEYPFSTGRNFHEILRVIDSLQLADSHNVMTPANWENGDDLIINPSFVSEEKIQKEFPKGYQKKLPYMRITSCPDINAMNINCLLSKGK